MQQVKEVNVKNLPVVGSIIISTKLKDKIDFLHRKVGKLEWSGILLYKLSSGVISKMQNLVFRAVDIYPMDIGSSTNTTFEYNADAVISMYDSIEDAMELSTGLCHSHQAMSSFISGTDFKEIQDNAASYNYYISLVVSFDENYVCKIAFPSKTVVKKTSTIRNEKGKYVTVKLEEEEESLLLGDLNVVFEQDNKLDKWFVERVATIKKEKVDKEKSRVKTYTPTTYTGNHRNWADRGDFNDYLTQPLTPTQAFSSPSFEKTFNPIVTNVAEKASKLELFLMGILGADVTEDDLTKDDLEDILDGVDDWNIKDFKEFEGLLEDNVIDAYNILFEHTDISEFSAILGGVISLIAETKSSHKVKRVATMLKNLLHDYEPSITK